MRHHDHQMLISGPEDYHPKVEMTDTSKLRKQACDACCYFTKQQNNDLEERSKSMTKLCGLMFFYLVVMTVEIVGGLKANSLAVLTDAAHLLTDIGGFSISLFTVWAAGWSATPHQSFGFSRIEVLGALLSIQLIWIVSGYLIFEAIVRLVHKQSDVNGELMFAIAAFGFAINFVMVMWLGHGHSHGHGHGHGHSHNHDHGHSHDARMEIEIHPHDSNEEGANLMVPISEGKKRAMNINIKGAYLHVMVDMIQSVGVMIAGLVIWIKPEWLMVDLVCTFFFSILALCTTLPILRNIFSILMESTPSEVDVVRLKGDLNSIKGLHDVHDLHVWAITQGKIVLSCHIIVEPSVNSHEILHNVKDLCEGTYGIHHVTAQIETLSEILEG